MSKIDFEMMLGFDYGEEGLDTWPLTDTQLRMLKMATGFEPTYDASIDDVDVGLYYNDSELEWLMDKMQPIIAEFKQKQDGGYFANDTNHSLVLETSDGKVIKGTVAEVVEQMIEITSKHEKTKSEKS